MLRGMKTFGTCFTGVVLALIFSLLVAAAVSADTFSAKTINDYGNVTVMEVTGNYDAKKLDGTINSEPRQAIAKEFFRLHKDEYDFLVVFSNFDFAMPETEARAFYHHIINNTMGIGQEIFDNSSLFCSNGKLQGFIDMGSIAKLAVDPTDPDFETTLSILGHEMLHRWGAYVRFKDSTGSYSTALLGNDNSHWSFLLDTQASLLYGNRWKDNNDGTFTSTAVEKYFSPLDLYLMGMRDKSQVPPMLLIDSPGIDPARSPEINETITGAARIITMDDIIAAEGERVPGFSSSQKNFRVAFVFITSPGTFTADELYGIENIRNGWVMRYSILTDGSGLVQVSPELKEDVGTNPGVTPPVVYPRDLPPNINDGVAWLMSNQKADGSWADAQQTSERDTAEALLVLENVSTSRENYSAGLQWLNGVAPENTDYLSRKIEAAAAGNDVSALLGQLVFMQNADGGWGSGQGLTSNPTDTAVVVRALAKAGYTEEAVISKAIAFLKGEQGPDGCWGNKTGGRVETTSYVLSAFSRYKGSYQLDDSIASGTAWLLQKQNSDGGFGNSPSTVYNTAIALMTLAELGASRDITNKALNYILALQSADGSWYASPYQTALAVKAVWNASVDPDLSISPDDISFIPSAVTKLPSNVIVSAAVHNLGATSVPAAKIDLYEGDSSSGNKLAEVTAAFPGQSATVVTFSVPVTDGNQHIFTVSADPDNQVQESSKTNNTATRNLDPISTYDFEILSSSLSVSQNPADIFKDVKITSKITNRGTMNAYNVQVKYYIDEPQGAFDIGTKTVSIPAGMTITDSITWKANKTGQDLPVTVQVDPFNSFAEISEDNNDAVTYLTVNGSTAPNLTISYKDITATPNPVNQNGSVHISAVIKNEGFSTADNINVNFYKGTPGVEGILLGTQTITSLKPGENGSVSADWTDIDGSGEKIIYIQVDPDDLIQEISEDDNSDFVTLNVLSLPDLAISMNSINFSPLAPKDGDVVTIGATVQNKGEQSASNITVTAYEGSDVIGTDTVPSVAGNSLASISFEYDTTGKKGVHVITIVADPGNSVEEQSKGNNSASRAFAVQDGNLWLTEQYISPNGDGVKDSTRFFFSLDTPQTLQIIVMDRKGKTVRTFSGSEFENIPGGDIVWDGLDDNGMVVPDGQYRIEIRDLNKTVLRSVLVTVDNNRSPMTDAIGTKYLLNTNLTCNIPDVGDWTWMHDESGIIFRNMDTTYPEYPEGLYSLSPDGQNISRIVPSEWTPQADASLGSYGVFQLSPNGEKVAFVLNKYNQSELWLVDRDGKNLTQLDSYGGYYGIWGIQWAPDERHIIYKAGHYGKELWVVGADGTGKTKIESSFDNTVNNYDLSRMWSNDSKNIVYATTSYLNGKNISNIRISDPAGNKKDIFQSEGYVRYVEWLNNNRLALVIYSDYSYQLWLIDATGNGNNIKLSDDYDYYSISNKLSTFSRPPDGQSFTFVTVSDGITSLNISDMDGNIRILYEAKEDDNDRCWPEINNVHWSADGKRIDFLSMWFGNYYCSNENGYKLVTVDLATKEAKSFPLRFSNIYDVSYLNLVWLSDGISILAQAASGTAYSDALYLINSSTGEVAPIVFDIYINNYLEGGAQYSLVSFLERYIAYYKRDSNCGGVHDDLLMTSSLLNLTANMWVTKDESAVTLSGVAADLNFDGYKLEYADIANPTQWNFIAPLSNVPVVNAIFTTWIPPHEGVFFVKLTVWDKAGNMAVSEKRVSWGASSSITNIYKSAEFFSPNGDGVKDTVSLNYTVFEPVHLEFIIYDSGNNIVRTFLEDHAIPGAAGIVWDGKDMTGNTVHDGKYTIKVLDFEFFVEVDSTPPEAALSLSAIKQDYDPAAKSGTRKLFADLNGHAVDKNLKSWTVEYGEGDNPEEWYELMSGSDLLAARDSQGNLLNPLKDVAVSHYEEDGIEFLVGKKLRITAEDNSGNRTTAVTNLLEEKIILCRHHMDESYIVFPLALPKALYPDLARQGIHDLGGLETIKLPLARVNVQFLKDRTWHDATAVDDLESGLIDLEWDNGLFGPANAVRLKAEDILGHEYLSNEILIEETFSLDGCKLTADNSLFEDLLLLKLQLKGVDYKVFDRSRGDTLPVGTFSLAPLPPCQSGDILSMTGTGISGKIYSAEDLLNCDKQPSPPLIDGFTLRVDYSEADCGFTTDGKAALSAVIEGVMDNMSLKTLSYYIDKNGKLELLRRLDVASGMLGKIAVDTSSLPESAYRVKAVLEYLDVNNGALLETTAENTLSVDRTLPTALITYPTTSLSLCPTKMTDTSGEWLAIPVEGRALDDRQVKRYELYYGTGDGSGTWMPAQTIINGEKVPIEKTTAAQGTLGLWDMAGLNGASYSLMLKVFDVAGNAGCYTASFTLDGTAEIADLKADKSLFSPNADGILDNVAISYRIDEYATVDVKVFNVIEASDGSGTLDQKPVRTIASGLRHSEGEGSALWDGRGDPGGVLPDGLYGIAVFVEDSCGNKNSKRVPVEVDNSPPTTIITYPRPSDSLGNIVEIRGTADDPHLESYTLEAGQGASPDQWNLISSGTAPINDNVLSVWNISALVGTWTLRLTAKDYAGNSHASSVTVDLSGRENLISALSAEPRIFSPNGDGKLDSAAITYTLTDACLVTTDVLDSEGIVKKTFTASAPSSGTYILIWDGRNSSGMAVPDGTYTIKLHAALSSNASVMQDETITAVVDSTLPMADIKLPVNDTYIKDSLVVNGTISDPNLMEYAISYTGIAIGPIDHAGQSRQDYTFGVVNDLPEGAYVLNIKAKDLAENMAEKNIAFTVDRTAPKVTLDNPKEGEYYGSDRNIINISGSITDASLETYSLRYGPGDNPSRWTELQGGTTIPANPQLFAWNVSTTSGIPDGLYTLSLFAKDKAGWTGEARVKIAVDNTFPEVSIISPQDGDYVKAPIDIKGTAYDANLDKYTLELSQGQCSSALKWGVMKTSNVSVKDAVVASWQALPPDGYYCLRLTAADKLGNKAEAKINSKVDTHPPASPLLSGKVENKKDASLSWAQNTEPDFAGYDIYRNSQKINTTPLNGVTYLNQDLDEGIYAYTVKAIDFAGNESLPSNEVKLKIDLTGPDAKISLPKDGASVSGLVDIKGTAYSSDDFKQYRLYIAQGANPATWSLIRKSPVPIPYGTLSQWDTLGLQGIYSIKLEAEDLTGNINSHQITVTLDDAPPAAPVLISAVPNGSNITLTWQANTEPDLAGYLLFRNGQFANATGIVIGDLKPYLITGTTYLDKNVPDGTFKYYLVAMDQASNVSDQSNTLEVTIDTHPPHVTITEPADKLKFDKKTLIKAESSDLDIESVQFQYKKTQDAVWTDLGTAATKIPYSVFMDPIALGMSYGDYDARAIATDLGGKTDPSPSSITVTYADVTAPAPPIGLKTIANGKDIHITWTANAESDLDGYYLYRTLGGAKTKINTSVVKDISYQDSGLADGLYTYEITASDNSGNESKPSGDRTARIYAPAIFQPYTPTDKGILQIAGNNAAASSSVDLFIDSGTGPASMGTVPADPNGNYSSALTLKPGENRITSQATDSMSDISRPSDMVVVVYDEPPAAPTGLSASVQDHTVGLSWNPSAEQDLSGYNLYRDGMKINVSVSITSGQTTASSGQPLMAFDGNMSTSWIPTYSYGTFGPVWWQIEFASPVLVNYMEIKWLNGSFAGKDYEIQAWSGYAWITQKMVTGNSDVSNMFEFKPSYRTKKMRIYITDTNYPSTYKYVGISEVILSGDDLITATSYSDSSLRDGRYSYELTAVDYYGFESPPSDEAKAEVGDVNPPSAPQNLTAAASGSTISLGWTATAEPDVAGYNVYKKSDQGWSKISPPPVSGTTYLDANLPNGTYTYRITAVDMVGNESSPSGEVSATVYVTPPQSPESLTALPSPQGCALQISWTYTGTAVTGFNLYRSTTSGGPYANIASTTVTSFSDTGLTNGTAYYYVVTATDAGNESSYSNEAMGIPSFEFTLPGPELYVPTIPGVTAILYDERTAVCGEANPAYRVELYKNSVSAGVTQPNNRDATESFSPVSVSGASLSPDATALAYADNGSLWLKNLRSGETTMIVQQADAPFVWSPDGSKIAYNYTEKYQYRLGIYDLNQGTSSPLSDEIFVSENSLSWTSDGAKVAYISNRGGSYNVWTKDLMTHTSTQVTSGSTPVNPSISPDGTKIVFYLSSALYLLDVVTGTTVQIYSQADSQAGRWSPEGRRVVFRANMNGYSDLFVYDSESGQTAQITNTPDYEYYPAWAPDGNSILYAFSGSTGYSLVVTQLQDLAHGSLMKAGIPNLGYLDRAKTGAIAYTTQDTLNLIYPRGYFCFEDVQLGEGENTFFVVALDQAGNTAGQSEEIAVIFDNSIRPDLQVTADDIFVYPPLPSAGNPVVIYAGVKNGGKTDIANVDVDVYLLDSAGALGLLKSLVIPSIAAGGEEVIGIDWAGSTAPGTNTIIVVVDPDDKIAECDESNNYTTKEISVVVDDKIVMKTSLDSEKYRSNQPVSIDISIVNPGEEKTLTVTTSIEDEVGNVINLVDTRSVYVPYGLQGITLTWNTGLTYAGDYRVHSVLSDAGGTIAQNIVPLSILADMQIDVTSTTDKVHYGPNENVTVSAGIKNSGNYYIIPVITARVKISDADGAVLYAEEREITSLLPGIVDTFTSTWNTGVHAPGSYKVSADIVVDNSIVSGKAVPFSIDQALIITGSVSALQPSLSVGDTLQVAYTVRNNGNVDASALPIKLLIADPATGNIVLSGLDVIGLPLNGIRSGQFVFSTQELNIKTYTAILNYEWEGSIRMVGSTSFKVKDVTSPVVRVISPVSDVRYGGMVDIEADVTDNASGVNRVEYRIDDRAWKALAVSDSSRGKFATSWFPGMADEGTHSISIRATDTAGNTSLPVSVGIAVELLTGTITVTPDPIYQGKDATLSYSTTNGSFGNVEDLSIEIRVININSNEIEQSHNDTIDVPAGTTVTGTIGMSTMTLSPDTYRVDLRALLSGMTTLKTLSTAFFEVKPGLDITKAIPDQKNLLVWLNYPCGEDGAKPGCVNKDLIDKALDEAGVSYLIVFGKKEFESELRNPFYTDFVILGAFNPIEDHISEELREQVYSGKGLLSSLFTRQNLNATVFGITEEGVLPGVDYPVAFLESASESIFQSYGRALNIRPSDMAENFGWLIETKKEETVRHPAMIKRMYGRGRVVFQAFDLGLSTGDSSFAKILTQLLDYLHTPADTTTYLPVSFVPVKIEAKSIGDVFSLRLTETYPSTLKLYDPLARQWVTDNPWIRERVLQPGDVKSLLYYVLTPDIKGIYPLHTEAGYFENGAYTFYQGFDTGISVEDDTVSMCGEIIASLTTLPVSRREKADAENSIRYVRNVSSRKAVTTDDLEMDISDLLAAVDSLCSITGADVTGIRLMIDGLLLSREGLWFVTYGDN